jgi:hypothetical protein
LSRLGAGLLDLQLYLLLQDPILLWIAFEGITLGGKSR